MELFDTELEAALVNMEKALFEARPDAEDRMLPGRVNDAIRAASDQVKRQDFPVDVHLLDDMARRWEKGYPDAERYAQDVRDAHEFTRLLIDRVREGR